MSRARKLPTQYYLAAAVAVAESERSPDRGGTLAVCWILSLSTRGKRGKREGVTCIAKKRDTATLLEARCFGRTYIWGRTFRRVKHQITKFRNGQSTTPRIQWKTERSYIGRDLYSPRAESTETTCRYVRATGGSQANKKQRVAMPCRTPLTRRAIASNEKFLVTGR